MYQAPRFESSECGFPRQPFRNSAKAPVKWRKPDGRDARPCSSSFPTRSGPARRMESLLAHIARKERDRLRVIQVDVDERADLVERLSVEDVPTLVLVGDARRSRGSRAARALRGSRRCSKSTSRLRAGDLVRRVRLQPRDHGERERGGARAVDDAVVERDADVADRAHDDLAVADDGARRDAVHAEDRRPRGG